MSGKDKFIRIAEDGFAKLGITGYDAERLRHVVSLADAVIPSFEPEKYEARVEYNGQFTIMFTTDDLIVDAERSADFLNLVREASVVRFRKESPDGETLLALLYFQV